MRFREILKYYVKVDNKGKRETMYEKYHSIIGENMCKQMQNENKSTEMPNFQITFRWKLDFRKLN